MNCTAEVTHSLVKVEENKKKAVFRNKANEKFQVSQIDGCLIKDGIRCDKLVTKDKVASVFVELKGADVQHACDQLFRSAHHENVKPLLTNSIGFLVICSKVPRFDSFVAKAKQRAMKEFKGGFHVIKNQCELDIERAAAIDGPH